MESSPAKRQRTHQQGLAAEVRALLDEGLFDSAATLAAFLLSSTHTTGASPSPLASQLSAPSTPSRKGENALSTSFPDLSQSHEGGATSTLASASSASAAAADDTENYALLGEALLGCGAARRALAAFLQALERTQLRPYDAAPTGGEKVRIKLKLSIAECFHRLEDDAQCIKAIEAVAARGRPPRWQLRLAQLYERTDRHTLAVTSYQVGSITHVASVNHLLALLLLSNTHSCSSPFLTLPFQAVVRARPMCVEAAQALVRLGVDAGTLRGMYAYKEHGFISTLLEAQAAATAYDYKRAVDTYTSLLSSSSSDAASASASASGETAARAPRSPSFAGCVPLLVAMARAQLQISDGGVAARTLERARRSDPLAVEGTGTLAWIYRHRGRGKALSELCAALLRAAPRRCETWIAAAWFADYGGNAEKATQCIDRALALKPRDAEALLARGALALAAGRADAAVAAFSRAYSVDKHDLRVFRGLVDAHLSVRAPLPQFKQALGTAKEALVLMPQNPRSLTLVGVVLAHSSEGRAKATRAFKRALTIDPFCSEAVAAMTNLLCGETRYADAIKLLTDFIDAGGGADDGDARGGSNGRDAAAATNDASDTYSVDAMHVTLGNVLVLSGDRPRALYHFHTAGGRGFAPALTALEQLEVREVESGDDDAEEGDYEEGDGEYEEEAY
jgi:tetratricopeptide (TPR) repeat protein